MNKYIFNLKNSVWLNRFKSDNRVILLHGSLAHIFDKNKASHQVPASRLIRQISDYLPASLLLASPYIGSFIHETIHLSGKELEQAESYKLPFKQTPDTRGIVSSIAMSKKKALTIHSRFRAEGVDLLNYFKEQNIKVSWRPAILTLIQNLLSFSSDVLRQKDYLIIYLQEEILRTRWNAPLPEFQNFHYWLPKLDFEKKQRYMETLLKDKQAKRTADSIVFNRLDNLSVDQSLLIDSLFRPRGKKVRLRSSQRSLKRKPAKFKRKITLNRALVGLSAGLAIWALVVNLELFKTKREYLDAQKGLAKLRARSKSLKRITEAERDYFRLSAFWETATELKVKPDVILNKLHDIFPPEVWIYRASINFRKIVLELRGYKEVDLSQLIESLNHHLGKTNLEQNEAIPFDKADLQKYRLIIDYSNTNLNNEKMDKK